MPDSEVPLVEAAKRYLKEHYGEDTVAMTVTRNGVKDGSGVLAVDCTVRIGAECQDNDRVDGVRAGKVSTMSARMR